MQGFMPTLPIEVEALGKLLPSYSLLLLFHVLRKAVSTCHWKKTCRKCLHTQTQPPDDGTWCKTARFPCSDLTFCAKKSLPLHNKPTLEKSK